MELKETTRCCYQIIIIFLFSVCLKRAVVCDVSILLALKNMNLTNKLETYVTVLDKHYLDCEEKLNLEDFFKNKKNLSPDELSDFLEIARTSGKTTFITMVDDPNSPEAKAAEEYINSHHLLPKNYKDTTEDEIEERGRKLFDPNTSINEKKKILMLLAHLGVYESYRILKRYQQNPDPELIYWAKMAFNECRTFAQQNLSDETLTALTLIDKIGRNNPCPCGSGKKFKKCCGKSI